MRTGTERSHAVSGLFPFALVALFALMALLVAALGVDVYREVIEAADENSRERIALSYVANKVRALDNGRARLDEEEGLRVLSLREEVGGETYVTRIYAWDGALRELFAREAADFVPAAGQALAPADGFCAEWAAEGLLRVEVERQGVRAETHVALRVEEVVGA